MRALEGCRKAVYGILFVLLISMSAYIFYGAVDTLDGAQALQKVLGGKMTALFLFGTAALLCVFLAWAFRRLVPCLERKKWAVPVLFGVLILLQAAMVLTVRTSLRHDHLKIFDTAAALLEKDTIADTHFRHYFMKYPNNIPVCLFTHLWLRGMSVLGIPREFWMESVKLLNLAFMNVGMFCTFRLVCRYRSRRTGFFFLLLLLVNPLWYVLGQMYYTSTLSLACSMGAVWLWDQAGGQQAPWKRYVLYAATGMVLAFGYRIRATVVITMAALLIYGVTELRQRPGRKEIAGVLAVLAGLFLAFSVCGQAERRYAGFDPSETGYPAVHWVMMSAQGEGQYNSADDAYTGSFSTREERTEADLRLLRERVAGMGPGGLLKLFRNKLRVTFSDGTDDYPALFRTMRETSPVQKYVNGGRSDVLALYAHGYHGMLTGLVLLASAVRVIRREKSRLDLLAFQICGAYLFYLIWEADRAYSIPFMLMLLLWGAMGMETASEAVEGLRMRFRALVPLPWLAGGCLLLLGAGTAVLSGRSGLPVREYAVLQDQETSDSLLLQTEFTQTFRTGQPFDHVDLWVANWDGGANDSVYDVQVLDEAGRVAAGGELVGAEAPCMEAYSISFERVVPDREQVYQIQVRLKNPDCRIRTDFLYYQSGAWDMYPEGALHAPEEVPLVDLAFAVYEER